jgi:hypothetical protein
MTWSQYEIEIVKDRHQESSTDAREHGAARVTRKSAEPNHGRTFIEMTARSSNCRWPTCQNAQGQHLFCFGTRHGSSSWYCAEHRIQSIKP